MDYQKAKELIDRCGEFVINDNGDIKRKRLFVSTDDAICEYAKRSRTRGYKIPESVVERWVSLERYVTPEKNLVKKYKRYAEKASFTNPFIRKCINADESKSCYENSLTTGTRIDGQIISLNAIAKYAPLQVEMFRRCLKEKKNMNSYRFDFRGYDGSLEIKVCEEDTDYCKKGDIQGWFSKEYRNCGNGYYYLLVNDENFIGYDID